MSQGPDPAAGRAVEREDVEALLEVRRELGPSYDAALVDSFAERVERAVAERVDARIAEDRTRREEESRSSGHQLTIAIVSVCTGVPITAISAAIAHVPGLAIAWGGIAAVNVAHALRSRARP